MVNRGSIAAAFLFLAACRSGTAPPNPYAGLWHPQSGLAFYGDPGTFYDVIGCSWGVAALTVKNDGTFEQSWSPCSGPTQQTYPTATVKGAITASGNVSGTLSRGPITSEFSGTCSAPTLTATCTGHFSPATVWSFFQMTRS